MRIKREHKPPIRFKELKCGDVFEFDECVYIKITYYNSKENAYNLTNNSMRVFGFETKVIELQSELSVW